MRESRLGRFIYAGLFFCLFSLQTFSEPILQIGEEETAAPLGGRSTIAVDSKGQAHIIVDDGECCAGRRWLLAHRIGGSWSKTTLISPEQVGKPGRLYVPFLVIDADDRAWASGYVHGPGSGLVLLESVSTNPTMKWHRGFSAGDGSGNAEIDPNRPGHATYYSRDKIRIFDSSGKIVEEKGMFLDGWKSQRSRIHPQTGVLHIVSNQGSKYWNSDLQKAGKPSVTWLDQNAFPQSGSELNYGTIEIDLKNPSGAYTVVGAGNGIALNIWNGSQFLYKPSQLLVVAPKGLGYGNGISRWGPKMAPAPDGGVFVIWTTDDEKINFRYVSSLGVLGKVNDLGPGKNGNLVLDKNGDLHVSYGRGGLRYRKVLVDKALAGTHSFSMLRQRNKASSSTFFQGSMGLRQSNGTLETFFTINGRPMPEVRIQGLGE